MENDDKSYKNMSDKEKRKCWFIFITIISVNFIAYQIVLTVFKDNQKVNILARIIGLFTFLLPMNMFCRPIAEWIVDRIFGD